MTRFIIFAAILGLQCCSGFSEDITELTIRAGQNERLRPTFSFNYKECILKANNGSEYSYDRDTHPIPGKVETPYLIVYACEVTILDFGENDVGYWSITVRDSEKDTVYNYKFYLETNLSPSYRITAYEGHYIFLGIDDALLDGITSCSITDPHDNTTDLLKEKMENVEVTGKCSIKMIANRNYTSEGVWRIKAIVNEFYIYKSAVHISVTADKPGNYKKETVRLERGKEGKIEVGPEDTVFCQLEDPKGVLLPLESGKCDHKLSTVTTYHDGVWTARYGLLGKMDTIEIKFNVSTYGVETTKAEVKKENNGVISIAYHFTIDSFKFCRFIRPDGKIIQFTIGAGNNEYESYGNATSDRQTTNMFCGLKILKPSARDFGTWKCHVISHVTHLREVLHAGTIFHVDGSMQARSFVGAIPASGVKTSAKDTIVRSGDSFEIKCNADVILSYCWVRSPNGTAYSVGNKENSKGTILPYSGLGLSLGDCRATVSTADDSHHGQWKCVMGVLGGSEIEETVNVVVTESFLVPEQKKINVSTDNENSVTMNCLLHPYVEEMDIDYCRWVRPDGHGIHNSLNEQYVTESNRKSCALVITGSNVKNDIGRWTCVAGLTGSRTEEAWATIDLIPRSSEYSNKILMGVLTGIGLFLVMVGSIFAVIILRRRRQLPPKYPPAYVSEPYLPPISQEKNGQKPYGF